MHPIQFVYFPLISRNWIVKRLKFQGWNHGNMNELTHFLEELSSWKSANPKALEKISELCQHAEEKIGHKGRKVELEEALRYRTMESNS